MRVLLIYELIPEETKLFVFDNVNPDDELYKKLILANGHYENYVGDAGGNDGTEFLSNYVVNCVSLSVADLPSSGPFDAVFHSGFGL